MFKENSPTPVGASPRVRLGSTWPHGIINGFPTLIRRLNVRDGIINGFPTLIRRLNVRDGIINGFPTLSLSYRPHILLVLLLPLLSLILASCDGGLFSNASWQAVGLQKQQLRIVEVSVKDPNTLYAGDAQGHIFVSSSAGQKWSQQSTGLPLPDVIHALSFDISGQKLYAATEKGLFILAGGTTVWQKVSATGLPLTAFTALVFLPGTPAVIYAGTSDQGIFVSRDDGASWQAARDGLPQGSVVNDLAFDPVQNQLWAATSAGAYRSAKSGTVWQPFNHGLPLSIVVNTIVPAAASGGTQRLLYMGTNHGVFLSQDAGVHWASNAQALSGVAIQRILVDFRSAGGNDAYIATSIGVFHSTDSGQTWQSVATGLPKDAPIYALTIGAANNAQLYAVGNGLYEFPGTGSTFEPLRLFTYILIGIFFFFLYRLGTRGRSAAKSMLKPERIQSTPVTRSPDDTSHTA